MSRVGIVWGSTMGNTGDAADRLGELLGLALADVRDIADVPEATLLKYDVLIIGCSTWNIGELQYDWLRRLTELAGNFHGKALSFFGAGDAFGYPDTFQDGIGILWEKFSSLGATLIGKWSTAGYDFNASRALLDGGKHFVGLALDNENQEELTDSRLQAWARQLRVEIAALERPA